jgi:hypothetical protein
MSDLDLLRSLGEQIAPPSFDALRDTARRRSRRTTTLTAVLAAAAMAAVIATVQFELIDHRSTPQPTPQPVDTSRPLTYAEGATLHFGDQSVTMSSTVLEIDMVDGAAVARTGDGGIWLTDGSAPEQIGSLGTPAPAFKPELPFYYGDGVGFVVSNNAGSLVGWFEFPQPNQPELVVYDTASGEETFRQPIDVKAGSTAVLTSVNQQYAYWDLDPVPYEDPASIGRLDLATGEQTNSKPVGDGGPDTFEPDPPALGPRTILVSHHEGGGGPYAVEDGIHLQLGRHGGHIEPLGAQPFEVLDGGTRTPFTNLAWPTGYDIPNQAPGWLTQWIDDDSFVIGFHGYQGRQLSDLLVCHWSTSSCEVVAQSVDAVLPEIG